MEGNRVRAGDRASEDGGRAWTTLDNHFRCIEVSTDYEFALIYVRKQIETRYLIDIIVQNKVKCILFVFVQIELEAPYLLGKQINH